MSALLRPSIPAGRWILLACGLTFSIAGHAQSPIPRDFPRYDWEPTIAQPGARYVGSAACAACHAIESASQPSTPMAKASERPEDSEILRDYPRLKTQVGPYTYEIRREGSTSVYSVSQGARTIVVPILAAIGSGVGTVGQTYVLEYDGFFIESEVTYYDRIHGLDVTVGHQGRKPTSLDGALGMLLTWRDEWLCYGCHSTAAVSGYHLQLDKMIPGIGCEGCHGAGADHIAAVENGQFENLRIFNPGSLSPGELNDFCGACHRTLLTEKLLGIHGTQNVRFEAYRLVRSRCYAPGDRRISCIACHNPHEPLERNADTYNAKCLACHAPAPAGGTASLRRALPCPTAQHDCVKCHMPKVELPLAHATFTDHWIRVALPGAPYPDN